MSLEKLVQLGWYKAEPSSPKEIADLFSIVDRSQAYMKVEGISDDLRFQAACNGILTLANIALRASGFRVSPCQGHHQRVIESLEHTLMTQDAAAREIGAQDRISFAEEKHHELRLGRRRLAHRSRAGHKGLERFARTGE
jgi:hypothetical protein